MWHVADEVRKKTSENTNVIGSVKFDVSRIITHDVAAGSPSARANEILDDILALVNLKEVSPVCNKDSTSSKIQSSTKMNSPTKEVWPNEITLITHRATTVKDNMNWHQLDEIQDFHAFNEDKLFPDLDDIVMDEYQNV
ncbi:unnamed protein product [Rotaria magnacalcarata]|uniref:Uncharacterized protein n=1 Tax=Rotaria magnacalcarata TaxID=392030 RepID=A0A816Q807_9BILA|nr:unnamed protein product [Rotaria magnacalcarata]